MDNVPAPGFPCEAAEPGIEFRAIITALVMRGELR